MESISVVGIERRQRNRPDFAIESQESNVLGSFVVTRKEVVAPDIREMPSGRFNFPRQVLLGIEVHGARAFGDACAVRTAILGPSATDRPMGRIGTVKLIRNRIYPSSSGSV